MYLAEGISVFSSVWIRSHWSIYHCQTWTREEQLSHKLKFNYWTCYSHIVLWILKVLLHKNYYSASLQNSSFWSFFFQFVTCESGSVGFWWPCCWLLSVCCWCWGLKCLLEAILPFHTWSTCSPWWKAPLDPHSERAKAIMLVSDFWKYSWCHFSVHPAWGLHNWGKLLFADQYIKMSSLDNVFDNGKYFCF